MHSAWIHRVYVPKKNNKSIVYFNNRDIVGFIESRCSQSTAIQNEVIKEVMKKKRTAALSKLGRTFPYLFFVYVLVCFVFYYKSFASTDLATNKMCIHVALKICNTRSNFYFLHG